MLFFDLPLQLQIIQLDLVPDGYPDFLEEELINVDMLVSM